MDWEWGKFHPTIQDIGVTSKSNTRRSVEGVFLGKPPNSIINCRTKWKSPISQTTHTGSLKQHSPRMKQNQN